MGQEQLMTTWDKPIAEMTRDEIIDALHLDRMVMRVADKISGEFYSHLRHGDRALNSRLTGHKDKTFEVSCEEDIQPIRDWITENKAKSTHVLTPGPSSSPTGRLLEVTIWY